MGMGMVTVRGRREQGEYNLVSFFSVPGLDNSITIAILQLTVRPRAGDEGRPNIVTLKRAKFTPGEFPVV